MWLGERDVPIKAPFFSKDALRSRAEQFLSEHHQSGSIPVPIEWIIDNDFNIDIVPMPGLHQHFDTDGYITSDLTEIRVDQAVYESRPTRYRFTLAHELGHKLLHPDFFAQLRFTSVEEWKRCREAIPEREYGYVEYHANEWAGLVLVPPDQLSHAFDEALEKARSIDMSPDGDPAVWEYIDTWIASRFEVSPQVIQRRGKNDGLWE